MPFHDSPNAAACDEQAQRLCLRGPGKDLAASRNDMHDQWEHFEHGADIGVRGLAATKAGAFEQAALALTAEVTDPARVAQPKAVTIRCDARRDQLRTGQPADPDAPGA